MKKCNTYNRLLFGALFFIIVAALFLHYSSASLLIETVKKINPYLITLCFLIYLFIYVLRTFRFRLISPVKSFGDNFVIAAIVNFFNNILPTGVGDAMYPYLLKKIHVVPYSKSFSDIIIFRMFDLANIVLILLLALGSLVLHLSFFVLLLVFILGQFAVVFGYSFIIRKANWYGSRRPEQVPTYFFQRVRRLIRNIISQMSNHSLPELLLIQIFSLCIAIAMLWYAFTLLRGLDLITSLSVSALGWSLSSLGGAFPIQGLFSFGTTEIGWIIPLVAYAGFTTRFSIAVSVSYHLLTLSFALILSLAIVPYLLRMKKER